MGNQYNIINIESIKQSFKSENYTLLSKKYINSKQYLDFICLNGHKHKITWSSWQQGHRCKYCDKYNKPILYKNVKQSFENEGYILLSKTYINNSSYLNFICNNNHKHKIKWSNWTQGQRCGRCKGNIEVTYEQVKESFKQEEYVLLSTEYKGAFEYLKYICPKGHKHKITWSNWQKGQRCPECSYIDGSSKPEKEIVNYIKNNYSGIVKENDRTTIKNPKTKHYLELDIWLPELRKAIEYNGSYWHSDKYQQWKDNYKQQWCNKNSVDLLIIKDEDWRENKDLNKVLNFINY